ncbi:MAG: permease-like cell division protein FtsX [Acidimicrobiales bacterium]
MIDVEDQLAQHLARKAAEATPRSDLDAVTTQPALILRLTPTTHVGAQRRVRLVAVAASAIMVATVAVVVVRANPKPNVTAARPDSTCTVFMRADASEDQTAAIGEQLRQRTEVTHLYGVTKAQAYLEFLKLFGDREDLARSVTADVLPASWKFDLAPNTDTARAQISSLLAPDVSIAQARCLDPVTGEPITIVASRNPPQPGSPAAQQLADIGRDGATSMGWSLTLLNASEKPAPPAASEQTPSQMLMAAFTDGPRTLTVTINVTNNTAPDSAFKFVHQTARGPLYQLADRGSFRSLYLFGQGFVANVTSDGRDDQARTLAELTEFITSVSQRWIDR